MQENRTTPLVGCGLTARSTATHKSGAPSTRTLRLCKKSLRYDRDMAAEKSTSQNTPYSMIVVSGRVNVPRKLSHTFSLELFVQPR